VSHAAPPPPKVTAERKPVERARSEEYYDVKTTVFNALLTHPLQASAIGAYLRH
jgi:hypothetical protein